MSANPFVLADQDRAEQFALLSRKRGLLRRFEVWEDFRGDVWARKRFERHCFAVSLLGPGWVFDPYAQERRAEDLDERRRLMESADTERRQRELDDIVWRLRFGGIAERPGRERLDRAGERERCPEPEPSSRPICFRNSGVTGLQLSSSGRYIPKGCHRTTSTTLTMNGVLAMAASSRDHVAVCFGRT